MKSCKRERERGVVLLMAMLVIILMLGMSWALLLISLSEKRLSEYNRARLEGTYMAEGATEQAEKDIRDTIANKTDIPSEGSVTFGDTVVFYTIEARVDDEGDPLQRIIVDPVGIQTITQPFMVTAQTEVRGVPITLRKIVDVCRTPIFQFLTYYDADLEILPGPSAIFRGRVHSNEDIYIGCGGDLKMNTNYIHCAGKMYRQRKDDLSPSTGVVHIRVYEPDFVASLETGHYKIMESKEQFTPPSESGFDSYFEDPYGEYANWTEGVWDRWGAEGSCTVLTSEHGITRSSTPQVESIQPGEYFHSEAGLVIIDDKIYDAEGDEITDWPDVDGDEVPDYPLSESTFFEGREETNITVTNIDLALLSRTPYYPSNGLIYVYRTDASVENPNGIRLMNGSLLKGPLTVVSPDPVYIWGDYNTGVDKGQYPDEDPEGNPYNIPSGKKPAAVITDAVNILSNAWDDSVKQDNGTLPNAKATTINSAFITGNYETTLGRYNGGFENLPRFHEKWTGQKCKIRGSFVNIWESIIADGDWIYGSDNYTAPHRDWDYDLDFNTFSNLPPYTPEVVSISRVIWLNR